MKAAVAKLGKRTRFTPSPKFAPGAMKIHNSQNLINAGVAKLGKRTRFTPSPKFAPGAMKIHNSQNLINAGVAKLVDALVHPVRNRLEW